MEDVVVTGFWKGRRVFVTGHTGFKGSWLCAWLTDLGAEMTGYALAPTGDRSMYQSIDLGSRMVSVIADIRDRKLISGALGRANPEIVFHLAAQSLVRESYAKPLETFEVNIQGTANLLDACRDHPSVRSIVVITSDKCYLNEFDGRPFVEDDPLGGRDPYSASKAGAEIATAAYRASFFAGEFGCPRVAIATARAGNVIGGGDWAEDRIVPDLVRALIDQRPAAIRNASAVRPWQHILDPIWGYLLLAEKSFGGGEKYSTSFNFGPDTANSVAVQNVVERFANLWGPRLHWETKPEPSAPHEAPILALNASKARRILGWKPRLDLGHAIEATAAWYDAYLDRKDMAGFTAAQIRLYSTSDLLSLANTS